MDELSIVTDPLVKSIWHEIIFMHNYIIISVTDSLFDSHPTELWYAFVANSLLGYIPDMHTDTNKCVIGLNPFPCINFHDQV